MTNKNPLSLTKTIDNKIVPKTAVVTGGTRGIGFAIVQKFLENGANVALFGSRDETVEAALKSLAEICPESKGRVIGFAPNLTDKKSLEETFSKIAKKFGSIDIVVNNAGTASDTPIENYTEDEYDKVANLNLKSVFLVSQVAVPYLKETKGCILNTSSMVSLYGQPAGVMYPATKFAVNGLTKSLARELARDGIRVNAVAPGVTETDMIKGVSPEAVQYLISTIPLGRIGKPEDIANAFLFLASDLASYISGVVLSVDGLSRS